MCGFIGFVNDSGNGSSPIGKDLLSSLNHRGPDHTGTYSDAQVSLIHTRLSIQDTSVAANQPMISECQNYILVFNGEIYNFKELRNTLGKNVQLKSKSDTEVLLRLLIDRDIDEVLSSLNGMFSFVFYNKLTMELTLVRDRVGIKPLYYHHSDKAFGFSSELKSLFLTPNYKKILSSEAITSFLRFGYVPREKCIYHNTHKVLPGTYLKYDIKKNAVLTNKYWTLEEKSEKYDYPDVVSKTEELIRSSVKYRLISDVPVGCYLSGGIDSSLIASMMAEELGTVKTFNISFSEEQYNEGYKARLMADHISSEHYSFNCSVNDAIDMISLLNQTYDEPFADSSALPTLLLSKHTQSHLKVVMCADGGDELFGGYDKYRVYSRMQHWTKVPKSIKTFLSGKLKTLNNIKQIPRVEKLSSLMLAEEFEDIYFSGSTAFSQSELSSLLKFKNNISDLTAFKPVSFLNGFMLFDLHYLLPDDILTKVDRATMHYSIESREPLLDHRLVEYAFSIKPNLKYQYGAKSILKSVAKQYLPNSLLNQSKAGFNVPMDSWLRNELKYFLDQYFDITILSKHKFLEPVGFMKMKKLFLDGKLHVYKIWYMLVLLMWLEENKDYEDIN